MKIKLNELRIIFTFFDDGYFDTRSLNRDLICIFCHIVQTYSIKIFYFRVKSE